MVEVLVAALPTADDPQQIAATTAVQPARCDDAVIDDGPAVPPPDGDTGQEPASHQPRQMITVGPACRTVKLRCVKVRRPDLNPHGRICTGTEARAIAVADVADDAGDGLTVPAREAYVASAVDCYLALTAGRGARNSRECRSPEPGR